MHVHCTNIFNIMATHAYAWKDIICCSGSFVLFERVHGSHRTKLNQTVPQR